MTITKQNWLKRSISFLLTIAMVLSIGAVNVFAQDTNKTEKYTVPIKSLTTSAPIKPVKEAFNKAFGDSVTVTVNEDGTKTAHIKNHHMVIDFLGAKYDANVASIVDADTSIDGVQNATILSTKEEVYTKGIGSSEKIKITVPDEFIIPLNLDKNGSQNISITVDFMDSAMHGGKPSPTTVTLTLDMDNAVLDTSELQSLIEEYEKIAKENYTDDSYEALQTAIKKAKDVVSKPQSFENVNAMIKELKTAKENLKYNGADYSAVDKAIEKIPADSSIYTKESWDALEAAKKAVVNGLDSSKQEIVNSYATDIEEAISKLVLKDADYSVVEKAIASVPEDTSKYTDESVKKVKDAVEAVKYGLKADKQNEVNAMADAITAAVAELKMKDNSSSENNDVIDIKNLKDGIYEIPVALWHATQDKPSMAESSLNDTARIVVKNGQMTVYIYTKSMTFGTITASLQEMKVQHSNGSWESAKIETKGKDGNPNCFSFALDELNEYLTAKVNPHVALMENKDIDARLKFDLNSIKMISEKTDEKPLTPPTESVNYSQSNSNMNAVSPQTGNNTNIVFWYAMMITSAGFALVMLSINKRRPRDNKNS